MICFNQKRGGIKYMDKEAPIKKSINSALFLIELYKIKNNVEKLIIELEAMNDEQ